LALVLDASPAATAAGCQAALRETISGCRERGVHWLSVCLPASHNGQSGACYQILKAVRNYVQSEAEELAEQGVRFAPWPGAGLKGQGYRTLNEAESVRGLNRTLSSAGRLRVRAELLRVYFDLGCGGRQELLEAARRLAEEAAAGRLSAPEITPALLERRLAVPPVDLLIRTGGSRQISDFLMWQAAYAELLFVDVPWARFRGEHLRAAFADYAQRDRKFGALPACAQTATS
jgi:undecaprenyl diphosphate synthase